MHRATYQASGRRYSILALSLLSLAAGCRPAGSTVRQVTVARVEGDIDPRAGTLTLRVPSSGLRLASVENVPVNQNGTAGEGLPDTVELVTEWVSTDAGTCGRADAFCAGVTIRSFFAASELHNVFFEIKEMTPSTGGLGFAKTAEPTAGQPGALGDPVHATYALWAYPALLDTGDSTAGFNAATRTWYFDNLSAQSYHFVGRVMADLVAPAVAVVEPPAAAASGDLATCGGAATPLNTPTNCGECGRTAPAGSSCNYAVGGTTNGGPALAFGVTCEVGAETACDSGDSMAYSCVNLQTDPGNCGVCGHSCGTGTCTDGACSVSCGVEEAPCDSKCCPVGSTCTGSVCILVDASEIAVGTDHACAITATPRLPSLTAEASGVATQPNNVICWGQNWLDFFGDPVWTQGRPPPEFSLVSEDFWIPDGMYALSCGNYNSIALTSAPSDFRARRWGALQNPVYGFYTEATKFADGGYHGCAMVPGVGVYCYGYNAAGALGIGDSNLARFEQPEQVYVPSLPGRTWSDGGGLTATDIASGGDTTCVVEAAEAADCSVTCRGEDQVAGRVACWGDNAYGKAGAAGATTALLLPVELSGIDGAVAVTVSGTHALALTATGEVYAWGSNADGQFGEVSALEPGTISLTLPPYLPVSSLTAGEGFTCYVSSGTVYCAGRNDRGQLGDGTTTSRPSFAPVLGVSGATAVSAGGSPHVGGTGAGSACALAGGSIYCWGDNQQGQLGRGALGGFSPLASPVQLAPNDPL